MNLDVTTRTSFSAAYVRDARLNAFLYKLEATVECPQRAEDNKMVIEFSELQKYMKEASFDNTFMYTLGDTFGQDIANAMMNSGIKVKCVDYPLCAEGICNNIAVLLQGLLDIREPGVTLKELKLRETAESYVSWNREKI